MQKYVEALHADLIDSKPGKKESLVSLIQELCDLNLFLAFKKDDFAKYICCRLDAEKANGQPAPVSVWRRCLVRRPEHYLLSHCICMARLTVGATTVVYYYDIFSLRLFLVRVVRATHMYPS